MSPPLADIPRPGYQAELPHNMLFTMGGNSAEDLRNAHGWD